VGVFVGSYGFSGHLRLKSFCQLAESITKYKPLYLEENDAEIQIEIVSKLSNALRVKCVSIESKETADRFKGKFIYCLRNRFPDLSEDEYYFSDLIGLEVKNNKNELIGIVKSVEDYGGGAFLEISSNNGKNKLTIPFTKISVPIIDLSAKFIKVLTEEKTK
jgi:16S rRNA processing protein RimM